MYSLRNSLLKWQLEGRLAWLPWGLAVVLACLCSLLWWHAHQQQRIAITLERQARLHAAQLASQPKPLSLPQPAPTAGALASFPVIQTGPKLLYELENLLVHYRLPPEKLAYQWSPIPELGLVKLDCTLATPGDDIQLRRFLADAHARIPTLAFESITLRRVNGTAMTGDATLQFAVYFRKTTK